MTTQCRRSHTQSSHTRRHLTKFGYCKKIKSAQRRELEARRPESAATSRTVTVKRRTPTCVVRRHSTVVRSHARRAAARRAKVRVLVTVGLSERTVVTGESSNAICVVMVAWNILIRSRQRRSNETAKSIKGGARPTVDAGRSRQRAESAESSNATPRFTPQCRGGVS